MGKCITEYCEREAEASRLYCRVHRPELVKLARAEGPAAPSWQGPADMSEVRPTNAQGKSKWWRFILALLAAVALGVVYAVLTRH